MDTSQLVQDVINGTESPFKAIIFLNKVKEQLEKAVLEVQPYARQHILEMRCHTIFKEGHAITLDGSKLIVETIKQYFGKFEFVEWSDGNVSHYRYKGENFKAWEFGIKRKGGKVLQPGDPKIKSYIELRVNNIGI